MKKVLYGFGFGLLALTFALIPLAHAAVPGQGLTISPPISEPNVKPGQSITQTIILTNPTSKLVEVYPEAMDFKAKGDGGQPAFYNAEAGDKYSLAKWVSFNNSKIALTPEQVVNFNYTISIPADAEPGGHYGAMFFLSQPPKNQTTGSSVSIGSMIGSLVLVTVPGDITEKAAVESFTSNQNIYFNQPAVDVITRIANIGNVHFQPTGIVTIKNMMGQQVLSSNFNESNGNVLPDSTRRFDNNWKPSWTQVGEFTASLNVVYGSKAAPLTATYTFWILPIWFIATVLLVLALLIGLVTWAIVRFRKKHPKKQASQGSNSQTPSSNQPILR